MTRQPNVVVETRFWWRVEVLWIFFRVSVFGVLQKRRKRGGSYGFLYTLSKSSVYVSICMIHTCDVQSVLGEMGSQS